MKHKLHLHGCWRGGFKAGKKLASSAPTGHPNPLTATPTHFFLRPFSPPTASLSKEPSKIGHISKNNDMGCVYVPAIYHQASIFGLFIPRLCPQSFNLLPPKTSTANEHKHLKCDKCSFLHFHLLSRMCDSVITGR